MQGSPRVIIHPLSELIIIIYTVNPKRDLEVGLGVTTNQHDFDLGSSTVYKRIRVVLDASVDTTVAVGRNTGGN